jgi:signal transduction histidine kinase/CheY-like chemotaxis protein
VGTEVEPPDAQSTDHGPWGSQIQGYRAHYIAQQCLRAPGLGFPLVVLIVTLLAPALGWVTMLAWALMVAVLLGGRGLMASRYLRADPEQISAKSMIQVANASTWLLAFSVGVLCALAFPRLEVESRYLLTLTLMAWAGITMLVFTVRPRSWLWVGLLSLLPVLLSWVMLLEAEALKAALVLAVILVTQWLFVKQADAILIESYKNRLHNQQLLEVVQAERQKAALGRDRAEEANRAKSRFLAAASHDLRQPLHALSLNGALLHQQASTPELKLAADQMEASLRSLTAMFDALLDISKLDAGVLQLHREPLLLSRVISGIAAEYGVLARERGLRLVVDLPTVMVHSDSILLQRIVRNLVDNAFKYTVEGEVRISGVAVPDTGCVELRIQDTGLGIAPEELKHIFEEFYQGKAAEGRQDSGLGLGLAIVKRASELLGISVRVESRVGAGTVFRLSIPLAETTSIPSIPERVDPTSLTLPGLAVLAVDDEPMLRDAMQALLQAWGCRLRLAEDLEGARALLQDASWTPDVIISDVRLGSGQTGLDLVAIARVLCPKAVAVLLSGDTSSELLHQCQSLGITLLHKPVIAADLHAAIVQALSGRPAFVRPSEPPPP